MKYKAYAKYEFIRKLTVDADNEEDAAEIALEECLNEPPVDICEECEPYIEDVEELDDDEDIGMEC